MKPVTIIGGGLAGLSLGIGLRRADIPTTVYDAGSYPRHRVCGEFICGIQPSTLAYLGIEDLLSDAHHHRDIQFVHREKPVLKATLPRPALGLSRHALDYRLAQRFQELGGRLEEKQKRETPENSEAGTVWAAGRHVESSPWIGLKMHFSGLHPEADLELHLGNRGYAGLSAIEGGRCNVCGLFRKRPGIRGRKGALLFSYLEAAGLSSLAERLKAAKAHPESALGVSSVLFHKTFQQPGRCHLGDHYTVIPPFTGNGMSLAIESAALASEPLRRWSSGGPSWEDSVSDIQKRIQKHTRTRVLTARLLHPWIYQSAGQSILALMAKSGLLPFRPLFRLTH